MIIYEKCKTQIESITNSPYQKWSRSVLFYILISFLLVILVLYAVYSSPSKRIGEALIKEQLKNQTSLNTTRTTLKATTNTTPSSNFSTTSISSTKIKVLNKTTKSEFDRVWTLNQMQDGACVF
jgi:hypothetical protein